MLTIQVRRTRHAGHCWRSRDELIRDVLLWIPTHGRAKAGRPAWTYIQQLCEDTGCCPEDLPRAMNDGEEWRERVRDIRATSTIWWWWWWVTYHNLSQILDLDSRNYWFMQISKHSRKKDLQLSPIANMLLQEDAFQEIIEIMKLVGIIQCNPLNSEPCWQGLEYTNCILCKGFKPPTPASEIGMTLNCFWWWGSGECGVLHCHYSQVLSDSVW